MPLIHIVDYSLPWIKPRPSLPDAPISARGRLRPYDWASKTVHRRTLVEATAAIRSTPMPANEASATHAGGERAVPASAAFTSRDTKGQNAVPVGRHTSTASPSTNRDGARASAPIA